MLFANIFSYIALGCICILTGCLTLKLIAMYNSVLFLRHLQPEHVLQLVSKPLSQQPLDLLSKFGGEFFPFGQKDVRLHNFIDRRRSVIMRALANFFQSNLFRFSRLVHILCSALIVYVSLRWCMPKLVNVSFVAERALLLFAAMLPLLGNVGIAVEFIYSTAVLGGYAERFHGRKRGAMPQRLVELDVFLKLVRTSILGGATLSFVAATQYNALSGMDRVLPIKGQLSLEVLTSLFKVLFRCLYFTVSTFTTVGYGEISPQNMVGQATSILLMSQSFFFIILVSSAVMSSSVSAGRAGVIDSRDQDADCAKIGHSDQEHP